jgi:Holliday junction resolvasome RuvABC endonuclease subunit
VSNNYLDNFVNSIYGQIGEPTAYSLSRVSGWVLDNSNLGKLNNLIGTNYISEYITGVTGVTGYAITPQPGNNELAIYSLVFEYNYYSQLARDTAISAGTAAGDWTSLAEGDSRISRVNKNEVSKTLRGIASDTKQNLDKSVKMYLKYEATPNQVVGDDTVALNNYVIVEYNRNYYRELY